MAQYTYPLMMRPIKNGIEYWFPDWEECAHIFYPAGNEKFAVFDATKRLRSLCEAREAASKPFPIPGWYGGNPGQTNVIQRLVTINVIHNKDIKPEYFEEKGEEHMNVSYDPLPDTPADDAVNHPQHYTQSGIECIDAIDSVTSGYERPGHGYYAGQVLKYIWRAPFKGHYLQDLEKAQWYLNRLVKKVQDEADHGN